MNFYRPYSTTYLHDKMRRFSRYAVVVAIYGTSVFITTWIILGLAQAATGAIW